jgi:hypothetical protein
MKIRLSEYLQKLNQATELPPAPPDDEAQDRSLKALRRQRRVQLERYEKEYLREQIALENKKRDSSAFARGYPIIQSEVGTQFKPPKKQSLLGRGGIL